MPETGRGAMRGRAALLALALVALGPALASAQPAGDPLAAGREALERGDGVAAEIELRRALEAGTPRPAIAASLGEAYLLQGDYATAREWLGDGEFAPGQRQYGFHMLALLEMAQGNLPEAGAAFDAALEGNEGTAEIWVGIGRLRYRGGEHHLALAASLEALRLDPDDPGALEFRGQLARDAQGLQAALPWFRKGLKTAPDDLDLLGEYAATLGELGRAKDMLRVTRRMIELDGENPRAFYLQAVMAARAGDYTLARRLMWRTEGAFSEVPAALMLEGSLEMRAGNYALAVEAFDKLARYRPEDGRIRLLLARALLENGDTSEVIARYRDFADRADASPYLLTLIGRAYEIAGDRAAAAPYLDRAAQPVAPSIRPLPVGKQGELAIFRWGNDPYRLDAAIPKVRKLLDAADVAGAAAIVAQLSERYADSADIEVLAGDVALAGGDAAGALAKYRSAAEIRRSFPLVERMVVALRALGEQGAARALAIDYLRQHPQDADAALLCAQLTAESAEWGRANALLRYATQLRGEPRNPELYGALAETDLQLGDTGRAVTDGWAAYAMQRANPRTTQILARVMQQAGDAPAARVLAAKAQRSALR